MSARLGDASSGPQSTVNHLNHAPRQNRTPDSASKKPKWFKLGK